MSYMCIYLSIHIHIAPVRERFADFSFLAFRVLPFACVKVSFSPWY